MKLLTKEFTKRETVLIFALMIILVALLYYKFVDVPIKNAISEAQQEQTELLKTEETERAQAQKLQKLAETLEDAKADGANSQMLSYNGSSMEIAFLNEVLSKTDSYNLSFTNVTRTDDQIRRNFSLTFSVYSYDAAEEIFRELSASPYRMLIGDVNVSVQYHSDSYSVSKGLTTEVKVSLAATFYETMVGRTTDAGLPKNSAK